MLAFVWNLFVIFGCLDFVFVIICDTVFIYVYMHFIYGLFIHFSAYLCFLRILCKFLLSVLPTILLVILLLSCSVGTC